MFVVFISILPILINLIPKPLNAFFFGYSHTQKGIDATVPPSVGSLFVLMLHFFSPHNSIQFHSVREFDEYCFPQDIVSLTISKSCHLSNSHPEIQYLVRGQ